MNMPNYRDFYQKALIPICTNDLLRLHEMNHVLDLPASHWLIALEGQQKDSNIDYYIWKVTVYPSNEKGNFNWNTACYISTIYECIHEAYKHASNLELAGKSDQLLEIAAYKAISS
ncbi:hypothetical protein J2Z40_000474 [Cytobacillus eiseniae]|uniref:Uncharacterized protein n=1 Tax=Cytobacillus eiseniae TaxID=762947 RepID=A0ABS4RC04_9BACI|nr:hypothetical protein [Cytobacillus eiseniae]MBP2239921.1 hypothetical protein [Cytobacillus eiseniae]